MNRKSVLIAVTLALAASSGLAASAAANKPAAVAGMTELAPVNEKIGAPVGVYYRHVAKAASAGDPTLQLSFVPRMAGNLRVEFVADKGVAVSYGGGPLALQKAAASGVYNRSLRVQRAGSAPANIRAVVSMEVGDARFFSIFYIPADAVSADAMRLKASGAPAAKPATQKPVRQL